ncbi:hypothetical protein HBI67_095180 [Parastagonospora nodorum]|nr:hypothetical protein HBI66_165190 [Parastagonospora nodorum]KAH6069408.1 hypothetical protein HBI67_095180 [Parastagonospora nodorum]
MDGDVHEQGICEGVTKCQAGFLVWLGVPRQRPHVLWYVLYHTPDPGTLEISTSSSDPFQNTAYTTLAPVSKPWSHRGRIVSLSGKAAAKHRCSGTPRGGVNIRL